MLKMVKHWDELPGEGVNCLAHFFEKSLDNHLPGIIWLTHACSKGRSLSIILCTEN